MLSSQLPHLSMIGAISGLLCLNHIHSRPTTAEISCTWYMGPPYARLFRRCNSKILGARGHDACCETHCQAVRKGMPSATPVRLVEWSTFPPRPFSLQCVCDGSALLLLVAMPDSPIIHVHHVSIQCNIGSLVKKHRR